MKLYSLSPNEKNKLSQKVKNYANHEFAYQDTIDAWHDTMLNCIKEFKDKRKNWTIEEV